MERTKLNELELLPRTLIKVVWEDITDDTVGDPDKAHLSARTTYALFWDVVEDKSYSTECLVLTYTDDPDLTAQQGWLCIPLAVVAEVEVVRRPKKGRRKKVEDKAEVRQGG